MLWTGQKPQLRLRQKILQVPVACFSWVLRGKYTTASGIVKSSPGDGQGRRDSRTIKQIAALPMQIDYSSSQFAHGRSPLALRLKCRELGEIIALKNGRIHPWMKK
jgi:hypothetical protein